MSPEVISRNDAYRAGKIRYYSGRACKQGHVAERYVSTGGCVTCHNPFSRRIHPHRRDVEPYVCPKLWVIRSLTPEQFDRLAVYLQTCIDTFSEHEKKGSS